MSDINFQEELAQYLSKLRGLVSVGTPWWGFDVKSKPFGVQLYQGQILSRSMYPIHYEYIQKYRTIVTDEEWYSYADAHNGMCPYFSYADGNGTYRMPRIIDVHPRFSNYGDDVGKYVPAGIPNIYGTIATTRHTNAGTVHEGTGAFRGNYPNGASNSTFWASGATSPYVKYTMNAFHCSSVYGASDTVQPPAINMIVGEYVISGISDISVITEENILNSIGDLERQIGNVVTNEQLSVSLNKYNKSYVIDTYHSDTLWYRKYNDGFIEQGGVVSDVGSTTSYTITLGLTFSSTSYYVNFIGVGGPRYSSSDNNYIVSKSVSNFIFSKQDGITTAVNWYACGY